MQTRHNPSQKRLECVTMTDEQIRGNTKKFLFLLASTNIQLMFHKILNISFKGAGDINLLRFCICRKQSLLRFIADWIL